MKIDWAGCLFLSIYFGSFVYIGFWAYYQKQMSDTWQFITFIPFGLFCLYMAYNKMKK